MSSWMLIVIVAVLVVGVIIKRLIGEPLNARDLFVPPVVLLGIGIYGLTKAEHVEILWTVVGGAVGLAFGALRGTTVRLFVREGVLWQRYTGWTFLVWIVSVAANAGIGLLAGFLGAHREGQPIQLSIGISLIGEVIVIGWRALATRVPFASERRSILGRD
ncbi:hypothetical protein [Streptosporangium sp. NPDC000396]|uniref:hypothetical protein n=1 Tax=Streptosporangium sp. NPDC000396 TaxID=3366185 RepID=UPI0036CF12C8